MKIQIIVYLHFYEKSTITVVMGSRRHLNSDSYSPLCNTFHNKICFTNLDGISLKI